MAISLEIPQPSIIKCSLKITFLKYHSNLPGAKELNTSLTSWKLKRIFYEAAFMSINLWNVNYSISFQKHTIIQQTHFLWHLRKYHHSCNHIMRLCRKGTDWIPTWDHCYWSHPHKMNWVIHCMLSLQLKSSLIFIVTSIFISTSINIYT